MERTTNHDVKAIEYVLKERFAANEELSKVGLALRPDPERVRQT